MKAEDEESMEPELPSTEPPPLPTNAPPIPPTSHFMMDQVSRNRPDNSITKATDKTNNNTNKNSDSMKEELLNNIKSIENWKLEHELLLKVLFFFL